MKEINNKYRKELKRNKKAGKEENI